ncbi:hypothetical protein [Lentzea flava]|uniref:Uncharacterized protein n=1 Tax=Lentzea flava TaxID=103732 RepID=A0ABQ2UQI1_9PSEU|nr:hypothetical protein [Lentzea flava]MCP2200042.1 hypothetical protein [Lentzea flava]GGU45753.1 hypothetical protein GCM10010178_42760 [Lentzea flava]
MPIAVRFEFTPDDGGEGKKEVRRFDREHFLVGPESDENEMTSWAREAFVFLDEEWLGNYRGLGYYCVVIQEEEGLDVKILGECGSRVETVPAFAETRGWVNVHQNNSGEPCVHSGLWVSCAYTSPNCPQNCRASEILAEEPSGK